MRNLRLASATLARSTRPARWLACLPAVLTTLRAPCEYEEVVKKQVEQIQLEQEGEPGMPKSGMLASAAAERALWGLDDHAPPPTARGRKRAEQQDKSRVQPERAMVLVYLTVPRRSTFHVVLPSSIANIAHRASSSRSRCTAIRIGIGQALYMYNNSPRNSTSSLNTVLEF